MDVRILTASILSACTLAPMSFTYTRVAAVILAIGTSAQNLAFDVGDWFAITRVVVAIFETGPRRAFAFVQALKNGPPAVAVIVTVTTVHAVHIARIKNIAFSVCSTTTTVQLIPTGVKEVTITII